MIGKVVFWLHIREVPESDLSRRQAIVTGFFHGFPHLFETDAVIVSQIRPQKFPSTPFQLIFH
jgi:hypothetical protein